MMIAFEAQQQARQAVIRQIKMKGKAKVSLMPRAEITRLANEHLRRNAAELLAQAEASGAVQNLQLAHERRAVDAQAELLVRISSAKWRAKVIIGYARVSTDGQTLDAHKRPWRAGAERVFAEKVSGAVTDRSLARAIATLGPGTRYSSPMRKVSHGPNRHRAEHLGKRERTAHYWAD